MYAQGLCGFGIVLAGLFNGSPEMIQRDEAGLVITTVGDDFAGAELFSWTKQSFPALPVIMIADSANPVGMQDGFAVLLDPVTSEELLSVVHKLLQSV